MQPLDHSAQSFDHRFWDNYHLVTPPPRACCDRTDVTTFDHRRLLAPGWFVVTIYGKLNGPIGTLSQDLLQRGLSVRTDPDSAGVAPPFLEMLTEEIADLDKRFPHFWDAVIAAVLGMRLPS